MREEERDMFLTKVRRNEEEGVEIDLAVAGTGSRKCIDM